MIVNWRDADSQVLLADDCYRAAPAVTKTTDDSCELSRARARVLEESGQLRRLVAFCFPLPSSFSLFLSSSFFLILSFSLFFSLSLLSSMLERTRVVFFLEICEPFEFESNRSELHKI